MFTSPHDMGEQPKPPSPSTLPVPSPTTFDTSSPISHDASCPFCTISKVYLPYDPSSPPAPSSKSVSPELTFPNPSTFILLSTPLLTAFLDIMPLSPGHLLLCPRAHRPKLTDVTPDEAAELGKYVRILSAAVSKATGIQDWNVVQNNGAAAAQVVPHCHFHIIPRPELRDKRAERFTSTMFGRGQRDELDDEEGEKLAGEIRAAIAEVLLEDAEKAKL
ncbi:HIT-like domain-containing protein [Podospora australis]|uniref:HIT-like domain-containing protein n=1 Tax=Podospora australis TaxID=1536484 RepID=A0AAN6WWA8_9PEZI|nr:HIT-like domain-containing protein [Podospora australis]